MACQYADDKPANMDALFELSLQELTNLKVSGAAVRDIGLDLVPITSNPFKLSNCHTPASVEIVDKNTIQARGLNNVVEVVESMVGVLSGESPSEPYSFSMRGFTRDSIKVLVNGVSMGRTTFNMRPLSTANLQRVEIIKGPSSMLHGQGAAGGTINMVSKRAQLSTHHSRDIQLSQGDQHASYHADFSGPINANAGYHLNSSYRASRGWVDDSEAQYLSSSASYFVKVNGQLTVLLAWDAQQDQLPAYWGTPIVPRNVALKPLSGVIETNDDHVIDGATLGNNYNVADHKIDSKSHWQRLETHWQLTEHFDNQTTFYQFSADRNWQNAESYIYNGSSNALDRDRLYVKHVRELWGLASGFTLATQWADRPGSASLNLEYSENDLDHFVGFEPVDFFVDQVATQQPEPGTFHSFDVAGTVQIKKDTLLLRRSALILKNQTALTDALNVHLAYRLENQDIDRHFYNFDGSTRIDKTLKENYQQSSYSLGWLYALSEVGSVYGHVSEQHDDITGDFDAVSEITNFTPSDISQWEVGVKGMFDEQQSEMTLALYQITKDAASQQSGQAVTLNEQTSRGLEFAMRTIINSQYRVGGNLAYTDAQYGQYYDDNTGIDATDNTPVNVPQKMVSLWGSVNHIAQLPLEVGVGINYVSSRFANTSNTVKMLDYTLVNVFASYSHKDFRLALHVRNATDEVYAPWSDIFYARQVIIAPPRTWELSFQTRF